MRATTISGFLAIGLLALAGCDSSGPAREALSAGWATTPPAALANVEAAYKVSSLAWSPPVKEERVGTYRFATVGENQMRAYTSDGTDVSALGMSDLVASDIPSALALTEPFVDAAVPKASSADRRATATALADLAQRNAKGVVTLDGVEFRISSGMIHFRMRAKPA